MSAHLTAAELRKMSVEDIRKEVREKQAVASKSRLAIALQSEKDTAAYRRGRKEVARMLTILSEKESEQEQLNTGTKQATMPPPVSARKRTGAGRRKSAAAPSATTSS